MSFLSKWYTAIFGKELTPQQIVRRNQRLISRTIQKIERERYNLEREEKKQIQEIKRMAQKNQPDFVRSLANDLVRLRGQLKKLLKMKQNLQGVSIHLRSLETQQSITEALYQATKVLRGMNNRLNMPKVQAILKEFEKQSQVMEIKGDMIGETIDDVAGVEDDAEESDDIVAQVLDELGLQIKEQLPEAPRDSKAAVKKRVAENVNENGPGGSSISGASSTLDDELLERLERLRKT